jgi:hypothetical protein
MQLMPEGGGGGGLQQLKHLHPETVLAQKSAFQNKCIEWPYFTTASLQGGLLQKGCVIVYFQLKTNSLQLDAVTKQYLAKCPLF